MFAYTSLLIPIMNGVMAVIHKYDLTIDTLPQNFLGLAAGIITLIAKHGIIEIIRRIKDKFNIDKEEVLNDLDVPVIQKFATFGDADKNQQNHQRHEVFHIGKPNIDRRMVAFIKQFVLRFHCAAQKVWPMSFDLTSLRCIA